jgi:multiple sugar transport system permease protein
MKYRKIPILCAIVILLVFTAPILYVLFKSFSGNQYYELVINNYNYFKYALRTIGYSALSGFLSVVIALPVGYLFAKVRFRFRNIIFYIYILVMLLPFQATQLSGYLLFKRLNAIDNPITLIVTMSFSPLAVFLIRQCLVSLPDDIIDAFSLESKSVFKFLRLIVIPYAMPMLSTLFMLTFCATYSIVEQAYIYMPKNVEAYPLSAVLASLTDESYFAGCVVYLLPVLLVYLVLEKNMLKGMEYYRWN